jgi:4-hydroxy-2-oxoheptanedioate aldolase
MDRMALKRKLVSGKACLGTWVFMPSPDIMEIIGLAGFDFAVIDMEHSAITLSDAVSMIRAAETRGLAPLVRVSSLESTHILRSLDSGAHGIQLPHIETAEDAEEAVRYSKYHPAGQRGVATTTKGGGYTLDNIERHFISENRSSVIVLSLESKESLGDLDRIIEVPGADVIYIGPYDLSQSMGMPGKVDAPKVLKAMETSIRKIRRARKVAGSFAKTAVRARRLKDMGVNYLTCQADGSLIREAFEGIRSGIFKK